MAGFAPHSDDDGNFMTKRADMVGKMHGEVFDKLAKAAIDMKTKYDEKTKERKFELNDHVLVFYPKVALKGKFIKANAEWCGPFRVTKVLGDLTYEVAKTGKAPMRVHAQRLKPYYHGED